jgi:hypothetical protein
VLTGAIAGDPACLKIAADRLWPALRRTELSAIGDDVARCGR